jgi:NAD(P)-dependent dehydrogenase (short-subunit alcohol dehydrogenase family)
LTDVHKTQLTRSSVAFITGAASGIGLATAERLVNDGIKNIAIIDITVDRLSAAIASLTTICPSISLLPIGADCSKEADVERAMEETVKKFGRVDVCFNAAGISGQAGKIVEQSAVSFVLGQDKQERGRY